jgi:uncharacterized protein (DUF2336 family)
MATAGLDLAAELESALTEGTPERRTQMLLKVTDLFLSASSHLSERQVCLFDNVLVGLMSSVEAKALTRLSASMLEASFAPKEVIRRLARHEDANVAVPVLSRCDHVSDSDLVAMAGTRGQRHLRAIAVRKVLDETVTDVLLTRGDPGVLHAIAGNHGARLSDRGFRALVESAERDSVLAEKLRARRDIPKAMLPRLASYSIAVARPMPARTTPAGIDAAALPATPLAPARIPNPVDNAEIKAAVLALNCAGKLNDAAISRFAMDNRYGHVVASLSLLTDVPVEAVETVVASDSLEGLIVACRASRLDWWTAVTIIQNRPGCCPVSRKRLDESQQIFEALALSSAQLKLRSWPATCSAMEDRAPR